MSLSPLFSWRSAICDSDLTPTQRHVALTLSLHMNERGGSCFPSVSTLMTETGLAERTVREALRSITEKGWIVKEARSTDKGRTTSNLYTATLPWGVGAADAPTGVQQVQGEGAADAPPEGVNRGRTQEDVPPTPRKRGGLEPAHHPAFDAFWARYPRKAGKPAALRAFKKATATMTAIDTALIDGLERWCVFWKADRTDERMIPHPATWLNQERWNDIPPPVSSTLNTILQAAQRAEARRT